ncbi:MAG TPA: hypothetical protein VL463_36425 [Kofleriaceae bacterium]|nr:hypothetical protein [Kofleriaceae bacterium]
MKKSFPLLIALAACGGSSSSNPDAPAGTADAAADANVAPADAAVWTTPKCTTVMGTGGVTFTTDEGATLAPTDQQLTPPTYTRGLVALGDPNRLLAGTGNAILLSTDAGCTWRSIGTTDDTLVLNAAGAKRAYGWMDNGTVLVRVDDETITKLTAPGTSTIVGLGVDPANPDHVRIGDAATQLWDSTDAGASWTVQGNLASSDPNAFAYRAAFDPASLDHVIVGTIGTGAFVTTNGGDGKLGWAPAMGTAAGSSGRSNVFTAVISPVDPKIVWAQGIDISDGDKREVWRSTDGGATFTVVLTEGVDQISLQNGPPMFAHPTDANVLYVAFGVSFQNYGTDVFRYDAQSKALTKTHNQYHRLFAVAFSPVSPTLMYFGVSLEPTGG